MNERIESKSKFILDSMKSVLRLALEFSLSLLRTELYFSPPCHIPHPLPNSYAEALTPKVTVFGEGPIKR